MFSWFHAACDATMACRAGLLMTYFVRSFPAGTTAWESREMIFAVVGQFGGRLSGGWLGGRGRGRLEGRSVYHRCLACFPAISSLRGKIAGRGNTFSRGVSRLQLACLYCRTQLCRLTVMF